MKIRAVEHGPEGNEKLAIPGLLIYTYHIMRECKQRSSSCQYEAVFIM